MPGAILSETPLRMLVVFTPGGTDKMVEATARAGDGDIESLKSILNKFGTRIVGTTLFDNIYSRASPRP